MKRSPEPIHPDYDTLRSGIYRNENKEFQVIIENSPEKNERALKKQIKEDLRGQFLAHELKADKELQTFLKIHADDSPTLSKQTIKELRQFDVSLSLVINDLLPEVREAVVSTLNWARSQEPMPGMGKLDFISLTIAERAAAARNRPTTIPVDSQPLNAPTVNPPSIPSTLPLSANIPSALGNASTAPANLSPPPANLSPAPMDVPPASGDQSASPIQTREFTAPGPRSDVRAFDKDKPAYDDSKMSEANELLTVRQKLQSVEPNARSLRPDASAPSTVTTEQPTVKRQPPSTISPPPTDRPPPLPPADLPPPAQIQPIPSESQIAALKNLMAKFRESERTQVVDSPAPQMSAGSTTSIPPAPPAPALPSDLLQQPVNTASSAPGRPSQKAETKATESQSDLQTALAQARSQLKKKDDNPQSAQAAKLPGMTNGMSNALDKMMKSDATKDNAPLDEDGSAWDDDA